MLAAEQPTQPMPALRPPDAPPVGDPVICQAETQAVIDPIGSAIPESPRKPSSALLRGGGWNTGAQLAPLAVNLVLTPFVIHGLGVSQFGLYILATSIADFLGTFDGGLYASAQRYFAVYAGSGNSRSTNQLCVTLLVGAIGLGCAMVGLLFATAPFLVSLFHIPLQLRSEGLFMLRTLGVVIALELMRGVFAGMLNAHQRFALSSLTTVGQYGIYAVGVVMTVHNGWGLRGIAVTLLIQTGLSTAVLAIASLRYLSPSELRFLPRPEIREFIRYASRAQVSGLSDLINLQSDSMIIGGFLNVRGVAFYSSGRNFASQMRTLPWNAIAPAASLLGRKLGESGPAAVLKEFRHLQRLWVQVCSGWMAVAAGAAYFGVTQWLGPGFRLAGVVAIVLLVGYLFRLWAGMMTVYCQTVGHPELEARYGVASVAVNLALTLAFVYPFGVLGVVVATALGQLVGSLYLVRIVHARLSPTIPSFLGDVPWLASIVAAAVTVACELTAVGSLGTGPLGLLEAGIVALPGLLVFAVGLFGPRMLLRTARRQVGGFRGNVHRPRHRHG
jgi:O-antigen/teichoic acid export membrane protein